jgi:hypothetical protein
VDRAKASYVEKAGFSVEEDHADQFEAAKPRILN